MNQTLLVHYPTKSAIELTAKQLTLSDLPQMLHLQDLVYNQLNDKTWYACSSEEEFKAILDVRGCGVGYFTPENNLIAFGVYLRPQLESDNYGYDIELPINQLLKVGQIEATIVHPDFRGHRLQSLICSHLEDIALGLSTPLIMATVCPDNTFSLNTFLKLGYTIQKEKLKYGGLRRYILLKDASSTLNQPL